MRYFTMGVVPGPAGTAMMPGLPPTPRASTYTQVHIIGQPGTMGIPSPKPAVTSIGRERMTQPSYCAPDVFFPSIYYTTAANMHAPVSLFRDNPMPAPAIGAFGGVTALALPAARRRRAGGGLQIGWPATVQRWRSVNGVRTGS